MKVKLFMLLGLTTIPLLVAGQSKPCFYNKGKMSIVGTSTDNTILYVDGDFIVSRDATTNDVKSHVYVEKSKTVITGDFIEDMRYVDGNNSNVFSVPNANTSSYNTKSSVIEFRGAKQQNIKTRWGYNSYRKGANYINFPTIMVNNNNHVKIDPRIAVSAQVVDLTKGKLVLDSRRLVETSDTLYVDPQNKSQIKLADATDADGSSLIAHLYVPSTGKINYNWRPTSGLLKDIGTIQVQLAMDTLANNNDGNAAKGRSIVGMGSPFQQLSADYFMWNFLMFPWDNNIIGRLNYVETEPRTMIRAGTGFVVSMDPKGDVASNYTPAAIWAGVATSFADRTQNRYIFDRVSYDNLNNVYPMDKHQNKSTGAGVSSVNYAQLETSAETKEINLDAFDFERSTKELVGRSLKPYTDEQLNITNVGVGTNQQTLTLKSGYNYFSNPFTTPLDLSDIIAGTTVANNPNEWNVSSGGNDVGYSIYNLVWILNPSSKASGTYNFTTGAALDPNRVYVKYKYDLMASIGGTYNDGSGNKSVIAPLQMFVIYANNEGVGKKIVIPESKRKITDGSIFIRSASANVVSDDDFLFQVTDNKTKVYDRTSVVIRTPEQIKAQGFQSIGKMITTVSGNTDNTRSTAEYKSETLVGTIDDGPSPNSIIYTKDNEGLALESNFLAAKDGINEKSTTLYLTPSETAQDITIRLLRWNTKNRVRQIFLKDNKQNVEIELSSIGEYKTTVNPSDKADRFTTRYVFSNSGTSGIGDDITENQTSIYSYYKNNILTVTGFEGADLGSFISIYDIQGRLLKQEKVVDLKMDIPASFASGAYIVKVVGNKSYVSKFLVK